MNFAHYVQKWARAKPDAPAVALGSTVVYNYRSLATRVAALASGLTSLGLKPGDRVGLLLHNCPEYFELLFACWHAGLVAVPINAKLHASEYAYILQHSGTHWCFSSPGLFEPSGNHRVRVIEAGSAEYQQLFNYPAQSLYPSKPNDLAWLFYTSGTTGRPKGAMLSQRNLTTMCHCYFLDVDDVAPWTTMLHAAPLSHGSGLYALAHLMKGSCQVLPESGGFDVTELFSLFSTWEHCVFFAAPTMVRRLTRHPFDTDSAGLKSIIFGGAPMHVADILAYIERFGPRLCQLYGQGESPMTISGVTAAVYADSSHPRWQQRIASAGLPQSAVNLQIVNAQGQALPCGETGEIICQGDAVMLGYWENPEATNAAIRQDWLWTGDLGRLDEEGFLTLMDRSKDLIISGGSNIYPREVEEVLLRHPQVAEVSVVGAPDEEWGETVVAFVVTEDNKAAGNSLVQSLDSFCLEHMARFKRPSRYEFIATLPKNNYGKILKRELREYLG